MALEIVSVAMAAEHKIGSGLGVGGAFVETWTHGSLLGVERRDSRLAAEEIANYAASAAWEVASDPEIGRFSVSMPGGAIGLTYVYFLPVA